MPRTPRRRKKRIAGITISVVILLALAVALLGPWGPGKSLLFSKGKAKVTSRRTPTHTTGKSSSPQPSGSATNGRYAGGVVPKSEDTRPPCVAIVVDDTGNSTAPLSNWLKIGMCQRL